MLLSSKRKGEQCIGYLLFIYHIFINGLDSASGVCKKGVRSENGIYCKSEYSIYIS